MSAGLPLPERSPTASCSTRARRCRSHSATWSIRSTSSTISASTRSATFSCAKFPSARRQLQRRGNRDPHQLGPRQRHRQPCQPLAVDDRQELRRQGAGMRCALGRRPRHARSSSMHCMRSPASSRSRCWRRSSPSSPRPTAILPAKPGTEEDRPGSHGHRAL